MIIIDVNNMTLYNKDIIINMCDFCFELLKQKIKCSRRLCMVYGHCESTVQIQNRNIT